VCEASLTLKNAENKTRVSLLTQYRVLICHAHGFHTNGGKYEENAAGITVLSHYVTKHSAGATKDFRANFLQATNLSDEMILMKYSERFTDST
jgi:hypothetical protein